MNPLNLLDPDATTLPWVESPFFEHLIPSQGLSPRDEELVRRFARDGFVVVDHEMERFDQIADGIVADLHGHYGEHRRVQDAWMFHEGVRSLATPPRILDILSLLYRRRPIPFQTLNFEVGTQQPTHSDVIHFHSFPHHFMAGVWIPFEEVDEDNGPLHYFPGSHRLPDYDLDTLGLQPSYDNYPLYEQLVSGLQQVHRLERVDAKVKRGQAIIWAANLFHGGTPIRDPSRTRLSQVVHYYFSDCLYYIPLLSSPFRGRICLREVVDIGTGEIVPHRYRGQTVSLESAADTWRLPRPLPDFVRA
ncbi:MAG: phytanoyl-CoA dioxygenase family protein [Planctomycetota bacterium]